MAPVTQATAGEPALGTVLVEVYEAGHIAPPYSHAWAVMFVIGAIVMLALGYRAFRRERRLLKQAREVDLADRPLSEGVMIIKGRVEFARGETLAVRTEIDQLGTEKERKNQWSHRWREQERRTTARPFYVLRKDGARVRIEPSEGSLLVDAVDDWCWRDRENRTGAAQLSAGEWVIVEGVMHRGADPQSESAGAAYRDGPQGWVVRDESSGSLHLSTESLASRHLWKLKQIKRGFLAVVVAALVAPLFFSGYLARVFAGEAVIVEVSGKYTYTTRGRKGPTRRHYAVQYRVPPTKETKGRLGKADLRKRDWSTMREGLRAPAQIVRSAPSFSALGRGISIHALVWFFCAMTLAAAAVALSEYLGRKRWYEGKLESRGRGRLPEPRNLIEDDSVQGETRT